MRGRAATPARFVCKRWLGLERLSRDTIRFGASASPDKLVELFGRLFPNIQYVFVDECISGTLPVQCRKRCRFSLAKSWWNEGSVQSAFDDNGMGASCLSDCVLTAVGGSFVKLEKLSLIWCSSLIDAGLKSFAEKCRSVKSLNLQSCCVGDEGLTAIEECCNFLQDLNLRFCEGLTVRELVQLALGCGKTLKSIGVATCAKITDISLEAVGSHCRSLESLSLDSEIINDKGLLAVAKRCFTLKVLKLQCLNITDDALQAVGTNCSLLEVFALYRLQKFTDRSLFAIELMHIEINCCHNIGTGGLKSVGKFCARLSELALLYCQRIESDTIDEIGKGCKFLQALHLVDCSGIGDDSICSIARGCRYLKKLHTTFANVTRWEIEE
ncbi:F-box/LRR-repeat protein 4-like [Salvia divinorum]|uniref:F-box/LRR-repeat protein 4-like n=1 Tax=Salvia divinorum TaxID=28513 RepID=A0ABD1GWI4_SALDI